MNSEPFWNSVGDYIAVKMACFKRTLEMSTNPGLMFESQTCLFPWAQQKIQGVAKSKRRQINCGLTSGTTVYPVSSTEKEPPPEQTLQMYYAQARSSSPVLRISETQIDNHLSFGKRAIPLHTPDPWLSEFKVNSSETSFGSTELDQRTSSRTSFDFTDSGFADSSGAENSCQFLNSCENQNRQKVLGSPAYEHVGGVQMSTDEYEFTQFDLSPFTLSDFSDLHENMNFSKITPEKRPVSPALPHITACVGQPMYISTPVNNQIPRSKPCRHMDQPLTQGYDPTFTPATPMFLVSADGIFSTAVLPNWITYP